jgi:hypothetical protein
MKIDLEKLKKVERKYDDSGLSHYAIELMLKEVIAFNQAPYKLAPNNVMLSMNTLIDLGILIIEEDKKDPPVQQLNS